MVSQRPQGVFRANNQTDLGRRRRTLGLGRVERVVLGQEIGCLVGWVGNGPPGKYVAWVFKVGLGSA